MTEMEVHADRAPAVFSKGVADLAAWAESARAAHQVAQSLVNTSFVPEAFRGKAHEATAAILSGAEVGLSPMASLRSFDIIQGTAAARAITLRAIVQSVGHEMWTEESTPNKAIVCGRRRGSEQVEKSVWTIDRAAKLKLTGKPNWQNQPQTMLLARATSECARLVAADAILGVGYSAEEIEDSTETPSTVVTRGTGEKRTVRRAVAPTPVEPSVELVSEVEPEADPPVDPETGELWPDAAEVKP